jgi:hypothetical protein
MPGAAVATKLQPTGRLLGDRDPPDLGSLRFDLRRSLDATAFGEQITDPLEELGVCRRDPARALQAPRLFIGRGQEDDVAFEPFVGRSELEQRHQVDHRDTLRVERPSPPDVPIPDSSREGIDAPSSWFRGHRIEM